MEKSKIHITPLLIATFVFFTAHPFFARNIPFYWDSSFFSQVANFLYEEGFGSFILPLDIDAGSFPFYGSYMAFVWKIFGKNLLVSHLAMLPWILGVVWEFFKFSRRFLSEKFLGLSLLLLMFEPTFGMQCMIMAYDVPLVYFFFFILNKLLEEKRLAYSISLCFLTLYSVRSMMLVPAFFLIDILIFYQLFGRKNFFLQPVILYYLFPVVSLGSWFVYHHSQTGWYIFSPILENRGGEINSLPMMLRQAMYSVWHLLDFGRIFSCTFLGIITIWLWRKNKFDKNSLILAFITFIPFLVSLFFMIPLSNPIGHRYFLPSIVLLPVAVCNGLQLLNNAKISWALGVVFSLGLITGNCWLYPERYGNGWDASLKGLQVFGPYEKMGQYIRDCKITSAEVGTEYPFNLDRKFLYLENKNEQYTFLGDKPISEFRYLLRSNVCNTARLDELKKIEKNWLLLKEVKSAQVYLKLYENPAYKQSLFSSTSFTFYKQVTKDNICLFFCK